MLDDRLAISVERPDGSTTRWGPDEPLAENVPNTIELESSIPGGYRSFSSPLLRRIDLEYTDQNLADKINVYLPGGRPVWQGRLVQAPRSHGTTHEIIPGAVGHAAALRYFPAFREIYVDRDLSRWRDAPLERRLSHVTTAGPYASWGSAITGGVAWDLPVDVAIHDETSSELHYDAGPGLTISRLGYKGARTGAFTGFEAATLYLNNSLDHTGTSSSSALTLDDTVRSASGFTARRYALLRTYLSSGPVTLTAAHQQRFTKLAVYGSHGLPLQAISGEPDGVFASDVIADILDRAAPDISYTASSIETTDFPIPHLAFHDFISPEAAILLVNNYHQYEWGCYDDETFFYRAPDPDRLCWEARLGNGAHLRFEGHILDEVYNGVVVQYQDGLGNTKSVGPPAAYWNASTALVDATSTDLVDTSELNPINAWDIPRKWAILTVPYPTTQAGATQMGIVWLAEHLIPQRRGTLVVTGTGAMIHPTEGALPLSLVKAGDYARISDHPADVPRRIVHTRYRHSANERTLECDLDNSSFKLEAIVERYGISLTGIIN